MSKYTLVITTSFKKDTKRLKKRNYDISKLRYVVNELLDGKTLSEKYKNHSLSGNWKGYMECHIEPDWLLIYKIYDDTLILSLTRTGTHSDVGF